MDTVILLQLTRSIFTQWETVVSKDVIFDEDVRSSNSQDSPSMIEEREEVVVPETDSETRDESNSEGDEVRLGVDIPSPSTPTCRKLRWLTQTLQEAQEHVGAPRSSMRMQVFLLGDMLVMLH
jgi:hypothetical protein